MSRPRQEVYVPGKWIFAACWLMSVFLLACHRPHPTKVHILDEVLDETVIHSELPRVARKFLQHPVKIQVGSKTFLTTYLEIGVKVDEGTLKKKLENLHHDHTILEQVLQFFSKKSLEVSMPLPLTLDVAKATNFLLLIKAQVDKAVTESRLDPSHDVLIPGEAGFLFQVIDSLVDLQYEVRRLSSGGKAQTIILPGIEISSISASPELHQGDFSVELAKWETKYPHGSADSNRIGNLKLGAEKLDGKILLPGELFSFNETVGERTEKLGFRVAPEIGGGEYVDGVGGGMCQLASTLHAAAFFAGLDILESTPHSRPSSYITAGLDSTVYYPYPGNPKGKDLKIKNPFDFPIMIHFSVASGLVKVRILGKERPYDAVEFYREVLAIVPPEMVPIVREDPKLPMNIEVQEQPSHEGYTIRKYRCFVYHGTTQVVCPGKDDENITTNKFSCPKISGQKNCWTASYQKVPEIIRKGTGPFFLKVAKSAPAHPVLGIPDPEVPLVIRQ